GLDRGKERAAAEVDVRRHERSVMRNRDPALERSLVAAKRVQNIIAGDDGDPDRQALALRDVDDDVGRGKRIRGAHVADEPRAAPLEYRQQGLDARCEPRVVSVSQVLTPAEMRERDCALSQTLEHEKIERAMLGERER